MSSEERRYMPRVIVQSVYMSFMDYLISEGLKAADPLYIQKQSDFVLSRENSDGGFMGRIGGSDLYYTDFALRVLSACKWSGENVDTFGRYVQDYEKGLATIVDCFNWLNCVRMLEGWGVSLPVDSEHILRVIASHRVSGGGYSKDQSSLTSVYATFLAVLCMEMLGATDERTADLYEVISKLAFPEGGFAESVTDHGRQTNPTAAALSALTISGSVSIDNLPRHLQYFADSQRSDGGLAASEEITLGDLLSTFSGVAVLAFLGNLELVDLRKMAGFLKSVEYPNGGFRACLGDPEADIEYTYYGLGVLGILRSYLLNKR